MLAEIDGVDPAPGRRPQAARDGEWAAGCLLITSAACDCSENRSRPDQHAASVHAASSDATLVLVVCLCAHDEEFIGHLATDSAGNVISVEVTVGSNSSAWASSPQTAQAQLSPFVPSWLSSRPPSLEPPWSPAALRSGSPCAKLAIGRNDAPELLSRAITPVMAVIATHAARARVGRHFARPPVVPLLAAHGAGAGPSRTHGVLRVCGTEPSRGSLDPCTSPVLRLGPHRRSLIANRFQVPASTCEPRRR